MMSPKFAHSGSAFRMECCAARPIQIDLRPVWLSVGLAVLMAATVAARRNGMHIQWVRGHPGKGSDSRWGMVTESVIPLARLGLSRPALFDPEVRQ